MASHKTLKSVVRGLAESFTSLMNYVADDYVMGHVVYAAWASGATGFRVNLLTGATDPSPLLVWQVRESVSRLVKWLPDILRRSNSSLAFVREAELEITVDPTTRRRCANGFCESPFSCTVRIVDDRGKVYLYCIQDWWYPEKVPPPNGE
jgi:hypothetical protein